MPSPRTTFCLRNIVQNTQCRRSFNSSSTRPGPRSTLFPSSSSSSSSPSSSSPATKPPSKYQLLNARLNPQGANNNNTLPWSTTKNSSTSKLPISESQWQINAQQNALNNIRINPVGINPQEEPNEEEEAALIAFNKAYAPKAVGQLYTARDLSFGAWEEKEKVREAVTEMKEDPFKKLNINPVHEFKNYALLSHFVSSMGRILPASKTGCSAKNQRRLGRAIRRARALGFMPIWSRHPALYTNTYEERERRGNRSLFSSAEAIQFYKSI